MTWWLLAGAAAGGWAGRLAGLGELGAGAGAVGAWLVHSLLYPRVACWWCGGQPRRRDETGVFWRNCWVCGGTGQRRRIGARILARHR